MDQSLLNQSYQQTKQITNKTNDSSQICNEWRIIKHSNSFLMCIQSVYQVICLDGTGCGKYDYIVALAKKSIF